MDFSVNYYNNEYNKQYLFDEEIYLKYPGFSASLDEMVTMPKIKNKILLHGIVPSSGSIFDEHLCDNIDEWVKLFKEHNNRWVSLHFYYNSKLCCEKDIDKVCKNNIKKIREKLPNIPIIIENVPYPYKDINWFLYPEKISEYCNKYDLGMILDIAHMCVACKNLDMDVTDYISKLPLDKIIEIHISGYYDDGVKYEDAHLECFDTIYNLYYMILKIAKNVKMTTLEYPVYNNIPVVIKYLKDNDYDNIYNIQKKQIDKLKEIYNKCLNENKTKGV